MIEREKEKVELSDEDTQSVVGGNIWRLKDGRYAVYSERSDVKSPQIPILVTCDLVKAIKADYRENSDFYTGDDDMERDGLYGSHGKLLNDYYDYLDYLTQNN